MNTKGFPTKRCPICNNKIVMSRHLKYDVSALCYKDDHRYSIRMMDKKYYSNLNSYQGPIYNFIHMKIDGYYITYDFDNDFATIEKSQYPSCNKIEIPAKDFGNISKLYIQRLRNKCLTLQNFQ